MTYDQKSKCRYNGSLGAKFRIGMGQTTIPWRRNRNRSKAQIKAWVKTP